MSLNLKKDLKFTLTKLSANSGSESGHVCTTASEKHNLTGHHIDKSSSSNNTGYYQVDL